MRKIRVCDRCEYYAKSSYLVCPLHPSGVANDVETCDDFSPQYQIQVPLNPKVKQGDLRIAESLIEDLSYRDKREANQILAIALAEEMYDPAEELLKHPLSDFHYYVLCLSQMLTSYKLAENPENCSIELEPDRHSILMHQAKFLFIMDLQKYGVIGDGNFFMGTIIILLI